MTDQPQEKPFKFASLVRLTAATFAELQRDLSASTGFNVQIVEVKEEGAVEFEIDGDIVEVGFTEEDDQLTWPELIADITAQLMEGDDE